MQYMYPNTLPHFLCSSSSKKIAIDFGAYFANSGSRKLLAQRPITLVLMMINLYSYSTNNLVFIKFQIYRSRSLLVFSFNKGFQVMFWSQQGLIQELVHQDHIKYSRGVQLIGSCLDQVKKEKKTFKRRFPRRLVSCL